MSKTQILRSLVTERLAAAAEEIFVLFERTLTEYEGEIDRQRKLLHVLTPGMRTDFCGPHLLEREEDIPTEQLENGSSLLSCLEVSDVRFTSDPVSMKCENDGEHSHLLDRQVKDEPLQGLDEDAVQIPVKYEAGPGNPLPFQPLQPLQPLQPQRQSTRETHPLPRTSAEQMETQPDGEEWAASGLVSNSAPSDAPSEPQRDLLFSDCYGAEWSDSDDDEGLKDGESQPSGSRTLLSKREQNTADGLKRESTPITATSCCKVCGDYFPDVQSLNRHIAVHPSDCGLCGKHLQPMESLTAHLEAHRICTVCGEGFMSDTDIAAHISSRTGEKPSVCLVCGLYFCDSGALMAHMTTHSNEKPYSCSICGKGFSLKGTLKIHMKTHLEEKPLSCFVCGKGFIQSGTLNRHLRTHTNERPFSCFICGRGFSHSGNLKTHIRIHMNDRPFGCSVCGKRFSHSGNLKTHMRIHTDMRPFGCSICGKEFSQNGNLKTHMRIHADKRPFICSICGRGFSHSGNLTTHMRIHTNE